MSVGRTLMVFVLGLTAGCLQDRQTASDPPIPTAQQTSAASRDDAEGYIVKFETSQGDFLVRVYRDWAPYGADRFEELVDLGYYDDCRFFRVVEGFMAQTGISGDPVANARWKSASIPDDYVIESNLRGNVTFATSGPDSRSTQFFINFTNNSNLDADGFTPFGKVIEGMDVVDSLYSGYGDGPPRGNGPDQGRIQTEGNAYLARDFPQLDHIKKATIIKRFAGDESQ